MSALIFKRLLSGSFDLPARVASSSQNDKAPAHLNSAIHRAVCADKVETTSFDIATKPTQLSIGQFGVWWVMRRPVDRLFCVALLVKPWGDRPGYSTLPISLSFLRSGLAVMLICHKQLTPIGISGSDACDEPVTRVGVDQRCFVYRGFRTSATARSIASV